MTAFRFKGNTLISVALKVLKTFATIAALFYTLPIKIPS